MSPIVVVVILIIFVIGIISVFKTRKGATVDTGATIDTGDVGAYSPTGASGENRNCIVCPQVIQPCPICPPGKSCQTIPQTCNRCARVMCA